MNRGWIVLGAAWSSLVFGGVFWLTFPSDAMANRLAYQVDQAGHGKWKLDVDNVKPWWLGLSADNLTVSSTASGEPLPVLFADAVGLRVGFFGLVTRSPVFTAYLRLGDARLDLEASSAERKLRALKVEGDGVPLDKLLALLPGGAGGIDATGRVDLDVDLKMGAGLGKADGRFSLVGRDLSLDKVTVTSLGWEDKELGAGIDEVDLAINFDQGHGKVDRGAIVSSLAELEIEGDVDLDDEVGKTRIDLNLVAALKDWAGTPLEAYRTIVDGALGGATWSDGKAHYELKTALGRMSMSDLSAARERGGRARDARAAPPVGAATTPPPRLPPGVTAPPQPGAEPGSSPWDSTPTDQLPPNLRAERERREGRAHPADDRALDRDRLIEDEEDEEPIDELDEPPAPPEDEELPPPEDEDL